MPDPVQTALDKIDSIRANINTFQRTDNASLLEGALEMVEELHDDIEEILEDLEGSDDP